MANIKRSILLRVRIAFLLMFLLAIAIAYKVIAIQYLSGDKWTDASLYNRIQPVEVKATRGNIYSHDGSLLATSIPEYRLRFDTKVPSKKLYNEKLDSLCEYLAEMFRGEGKNTRQFKEYIEDARKKEKRYLKLGNRALNYDEMMEVKTWPIFRRGQMKGGLIFEKKEKRFKPFQILAKTTVGIYNDSIRKGTRGIEFSFQEYLKGTAGLKYHEREEDGSWRPMTEDDVKKAEHGLDVHTTIDINLQDVSEMALLDALKANNAERGCVILMEVKTGEIKAIANLKQSSRDSTKYYENYNYAVARSENPGSTFKLASAMALLEHTDIQLDDTIDVGNGVRKFYGVRLTDSHWGGFGKITFQECFEKSSNIGFAALTDSFFNTSLESQEMFLNYLKDYGLATDLNFQLYGTKVPYIPSPDDSRWSAITIPWLSMGYESMMTPLQILAFYNGVANNGKMISPILVKEIKKADQAIRTFEPTVIQERLCSKQTLKEVRTMLEGVVERGTAKNIKSNKYKIAGKTGTSQIYENGKYLREYYTSFAGYFPADNPKYSCIVTVVKPKVKKSGGKAAAPVFKKISDYIYGNDMSMHEVYTCEDQLEPGMFPLIRAGYYDDLLYLCEELKVPHNTNANVGELVRTRLVDGNTRVDWKRLLPLPDTTGNTSKIELPNLKDLTVKDVVPLLENMQLRIEYQGKIAGRVKQQSPAPGSNMQVGQKVTLVFN